MATVWWVVVGGGGWWWVVGGGWWVAQIIVVLTHLGLFTEIGLKELGEANDKMLRSLRARKVGGPGGYLSFKDKLVTLCAKQLGVMVDQLLPMEV